MRILKKNKLNYFEYNTIIIIHFGSTNIDYSIKDLRTHEWIYFGSELAACLFKYDLFESYDDYEFISIGQEAKEKAKDKEVFYVDKLSDKVEYLFAIEPNIKKPLKQEKDRLRQRAVVQYFKNLTEKIVNYHNLAPSKHRYIVTYPSHWTLEQASYLRCLLQRACIVDDDHSDHLIMYNEGEVILQYIQTSFRSFSNIREGQEYMICNLSGSKVEMHLYDIKEPLDPQGVIKNASRCDWNNGYIEEPAQMYIREENFFPETELYISSLLSTPSINITIKDLEDRLNKSGRNIKGWWKLDEIECFTVDENEKVTFISDDILQLLHDLYHERSNNVKESMTESPPRLIKDGYIELYSSEIKEKVLKPVCDRITQYIKNIIEVVPDTIDYVILVGSRDRSYWTQLVADKYKETTKKKMFIFNTNHILIGAADKYLYSMTAFDIYKPKIVHDDLDLSFKSRINSEDVIILIDYGLEKTRVSYMHTQPGQIAGEANIKHIMNWPGQSMLNRDFPTLNVMLIPKYPLDIGEDSDINLRWKRDLFSNHLSRNRSKTMFILQEKDGYNQQISTLANTIFYTFEKDKYGITLVTHQSYTLVKELLVATKTTNPIPSAYKMTRKRISFQEFSLLYLENLADFLYTYIYSKTGVEKDKYRYCITHDNQRYPEKFTLSNKDIRQIALESNLISAHIATNLLVLEREEATAIYCRKLIGTAAANDKETHLYFLQAQLHTDRCLLILNTVPLLDHEDSNSYRENGKTWECVHKYAEIEKISINFMDILSENLWIHMQKIGSLLLRKCEQHQAQKRFFNSKNMQLFKNIFYDYISTTKDLNLEDSEKEHTIRMCDKGLGSCCYLVTTSMDLLEFAFKPVIDQLVSIIQSSIVNESFFQGIQISDIFVMGEFLICKDYVSYRYLEELLLIKLKDFHFPRFDSLILQSMTKKTQVRKLNGREYQHVQDSDIKYRYDSLAQVSTSGSVMFSIDPKNLLVERIATRTYVIHLDYLSSTKTIYNHPGRTLDNGNSCHVIMLKGTPLKSLSLVEDTVSKDFMITNYDEDFSFNIEILVLEDDNVSYLTDKNMDEISWRNKFWDSNFEMLNTFNLSNDKFDNYSYPFSINFCLSQIFSYTLKVEKGKNSEEDRGYILEPILLKSGHNN